MTATSPFLDPTYLDDPYPRLAALRSVMACTTASARTSPVRRSA